MRFFSKTQVARGFTLVELLVVISIIAVLSSVVYANFNSARQSARDNIRKADLKDIQLALELYKAQNGRYPTGCNGDNAWSGNLGSSWQCTVTNVGTNNFIPGLVPAYMPSLPMEKFVANAVAYIYRVNTGGTGYKVIAHNAAEKNFIASYSDEFARCPASNGSVACPTTPNPKHYAVYNSVGQNW